MPARRLEIGPSTRRNRPVTTNRAFRSIQGEGVANVTNKALRFGIDIDGTTATPIRFLTANLSSTAAVSDVSTDHHRASTMPTERPTLNDRTF